MFWPRSLNELQRSKDAQRTFSFIGWTDRRTDVIKGGLTDEQIKGRFTPKIIIDTCSRDKDHLRSEDIGTVGVT